MEGDTFVRRCVIQQARCAMLSIESLLALGPEGDAVSMLPPCDAHIHVTDTLDASGVFVLLHYGLIALQASAHNVVWVSCRADGVAHWNSITRKAVSLHC